jgi:hypothetical protein
MNEFPLKGLTPKNNLRESIGEKQIRPPSSQDQATVRHRINGKLFDTMVLRPGRMHTTITVQRAIRDSPRMTGTSTMKYVNNQFIRFFWMI